MKIYNPMMLVIAIIQIVGGVYYCFKLQSPMLGIIQLTYAISNVIFSMMKGI